jgi:glycosyltransferase involved in cell wall biosynthesis
VSNITIDNATWHYFSKAHYYFKLSRLTKKLINAHLLSPTSFIPPLVSFCPTTTIVYDTASITPQRFVRNRKARILESLLFPHVLKRSSWVVTISHSVAKELAQMSNNDSSNILVVYPRLRGFPKPDLNDIENLHLKPHEYFLFVGTLEPRKNLVNLIQGYASFLLQTSKANPPKLVIAGQKGWHYNEILQLIETKSLENMVTLIESPTDSQLASLYAHCLCFCYVSHYEGFGMPILEAMSFDKAVLASDISVLNEVAGLSACFVDPKSISAIANGLHKLFEDNAFRHSLESHTTKQVKKLNHSKQMDQLISALLGIRSIHKVK